MSWPRTDERDGVGRGRHDLRHQQHEDGQRQQDGDTCGAREVINVNARPVFLSFASLLLTLVLTRFAGVSSKRRMGLTLKPLGPRVSSITLSDRVFSWKAPCKLPRPNQSPSFNYIDRLIGRVSETWRFFSFSVPRTVGAEL